MSDYSPYFTNESHTMAAGALLGYLIFKGIPAEPVKDDVGNYTDLITIDIPNLFAVVIKVQPPEQGVNRDPRPHSRACGIKAHEHGNECARDCPTCWPQGNTGVIR